MIPNAGSFFKNPIVSNAQLQQLSERYIDIPHYRVDSQHVKLPAGWLIEHAGFKGTSYGNAGVHDKQALVLVNRGGATGQEVIALAKNILISVHQKFNLMLEQEVRTVTQHGYQKIEVSCG